MLAWGAFGCTPEVDPPWLVERPTELAVSIEVTQQGPYGLRPADDDTRPFHEALPLDTVRIEPFIVDHGGPIAPDDLDARWVACTTLGCLDALENLDTLSSCATSFDPSGSCLLGNTPSITFTLPDFPPTLQQVSLFSLALAPSIVFIASRAGDPGADLCARRLRAREPLGHCVMMLRDLDLGSLAELVSAAETAGIEVDASDSNEELLEVPRNHVPFVRTFSVLGSSAREDGDVAASGAVPVVVGDEIAIEYRPEPADLDAFEVEIEGEPPLTYAETHSGQWWIDRDAIAFTSADLQARWTVSGDPGTAYVYFVLRDGRGSEAWGWLAFEVQG